MEPQRITKEEVKQRLDAGEPIIFLDTRSAKAWDESDLKIPGAIRVPADAVEQHLGEIARGRLIVTYCM